MRAELWVLAGAFAVVLVAGLCLAPVAGAVTGVRGAAPPEAVRIDLSERLADVRFEHDHEQILVRAEVQGEERLLDAEEWLRALDGVQRSGRVPSRLERLFPVTDHWSLVWIGVGLLGQALFTLRILLQWVTSERAKRSIVPVGFWWSSLGGGLLLLAYFLWRHDIVGILGQSTGAFVYARNLRLIYGQRTRARGLDQDRTQPLPMQAT